MSHRPPPSHGYSAPPASSAQGSRGPPLPPQGRGYGPPFPPQQNPGMGRGQPIAPTSALAQRPPEPPKQPREITVTVNCFEVNWKAPPVLYHYDVRIDPPNTGSNQTLGNSLIIDRMQHVFAQRFHPRGAYDGKYNFYTTAYIADHESFPVLMNTTRQPPPQERQRGHPVVEMRLVGAHDSQQLIDYINGGEAVPAGDVLQIQNCINVILRQAPYQNYPTAHNIRDRRAFFVRDGTRDLGAGLQLVRGYIQSMRAVKKGVVINVDTTTGLRWIEQDLLSTVYALFMHMRNPDTLSLPGQPNPASLQNITEQEINRLKHILRGVRVIPNHRPNALPRAITGFDRRGAAAIRLEEDDPSSATIRQYLHATYGTALRYPNIPCVLLGRGVALPLECCDIVPDQISNRKASPFMMRLVQQFSTQRPNVRLDEITKGVKRLKYNESDWVTNTLKMTVNETPMTVKGRVLIGPPVLYGGQGSNSVAIERGVWNAKNRVFYRPPTFTRWAIAWFVSSDIMRRNRDEVSAGLVRSMTGSGFHLQGSTRPPSFLVQNVAQLEYELDLICQKTQIHYKAPETEAPELLICIIDGASSVHTRIKHWGDCLRGIPVQPLKISKVLGAKGQYWGNVAMKLCIKMNGMTHVIPTHPWLLQVPTMVMGADTSHPAPGQMDQPTISAVVGSCDANVSKYNSTVRVQKGRQEIIEDMAEMVAHCVRMFEEHQRTTQNQRWVYPKRVVFYRDGVSEGQFAEVVRTEVAAVREGFEIVAEEVRQEYEAIVEDCERRKKTPPPPPVAEPKITFIVVGKRHHIRFFPKDRNDADSSGNAPAGLIVDTDIVHPNGQDCYLLSHAGLLGTSRPMHISVLVEENNMGRDLLQKLTFGLTHNFGRSTRTVSIPVPVYHAHLACGRAQIHFERDVVYGDEADGINSDDGQRNLGYFQNRFTQVHPRLANRMYWM